MTFSGLLVFAAAYALAVASPGPGVAAAVARGLGRGGSRAPAFVAGFVAGDLIWFALAAAGLSVLAQTFGALFTVVRWAGAAYLLWLAWRLWTTPVAPAGEAATAAEDRESPWAVFLGSLSLTLGNPKVIVFFMALLPSILDLGALTLVSALEVAAVIMVVLTLVMSGYVVLASRARALFRSPASLRRLNRVTGTALAGAAVAVVTRS